MNDVGGLYYTYYAGYDYGVLSDHDSGVLIYMEELTN